MVNTFTNPFTYHFIFVLSQIDDIKQNDYDSKQVIYTHIFDINDPPNEGPILGNSNGIIGEKKKTKKKYKKKPKKKQRNKNDIIFDIIIRIILFFIGQLHFFVKYYYIGKHTKKSKKKH